MTDNHMINLTEITGIMPMSGSCARRPAALIAQLAEPLAHFPLIRTSSL